MDAFYLFLVAIVFVLTMGLVYGLNALRGKE